MPLIKVFRRLVNTLESHPVFKEKEQKPQQEGLVRHMLSQYDPGQATQAHLLIVGTKEVTAAQAFSRLCSATEVATAAKQLHDEASPSRALMGLLWLTALAVIDAIIL